MKRWFRPLAYTLIMVLASLAVFGKPQEPADADVVLPVRAVVEHKLPDTGNDNVDQRDGVPTLQERADAALVDSLFAAAAPPMPVDAPAAPAAPPPPAIPELKVLGWMQSESTPYVFVEFSGDNYTLSPTQVAEDTYRFDRIGGGLAEFTYLPTGQSRQYPVSDPAVNE